MISAEWKESDSPIAVDEYVVPDLSGVTGFSPEDVSYNCAGRLSPAQGRLQRKQVLYELLGLAFVAGMAVIGLMHGSHLVPILMLIVVAAGTLKTFDKARATWAGEVFQADGDIWTEKHEDSDGDEFFAHIAGWKLEITKEAYKALVPGGPYRIFYIAGPNWAVGGHVLAGWRPAPPPPPQLEKKSWWRSLSANFQISE